MSQAGKVLHLYVEVRSVAEEEGQVLEGGNSGTSHLTLSCQDVLPHSQRSSTHSSPNRSPDLSPITRHHTGRGTQSLPPSKSSSRHSVSFQLQNPDATGSPTQFHRQDVLYDEFSQLLQVISPGMTGPGRHGSLGRAHSSDMDPYQERLPITPSSTSSGRLTVPTTPTTNRRSYDIQALEGEDGRTSVVTYGYIEKANVHSMGSRRELDNPLNRMEGQTLPAHLRKRLSDPVWCNGQPSLGDPYTNQPSPSQNRGTQGSPHLQRATLESVARDATYRAWEEFGSSEIRRQCGSHGPDNCSPTLPRHYQSPRCRSWGGSPVLPRSNHTLPSKTQLLEMDGGICRSAVNGLPRSPASDHLCAHTGYSSHSVVPASTLYSHGLPQSHQRPWTVDESPRLSSKFHPPLPAGRPTDIQHEIQSRSSPTSNQRSTGYQTSDNSHHCVDSSYNAKASKHYCAHNMSTFPSKSHFKPLHCSSRTRDAVVCRRSVSPSLHAEVACTEATKLSSTHVSPSPTPSPAESLRSEGPKMVASFLKESQPYASLQGQVSPEPLWGDNQNHKWKTDKPIPQTRLSPVPPLLSQTGLSSSASPALQARLNRVTTSQSPALDPHQQRSSSLSKDISTLHRYQPTQYTGGCKVPGMELRQQDHLLNRSPELCRRLLSSQNTDTLPVSWTSRHQEWRDTGPVQDRDELCVQDYRQANCKVYAPRKEENHGIDRENKGVITSVQGNQKSVEGVSMDQREEVQDHSGAGGTSSQSSSGVTGSVGDSFQLERNDSLFPETSSQSSHDTTDTGSGMQVGCTAG